MHVFFHIKLKKNASCFKSVFYHFKMQSDLFRGRSYHAKFWLFSLQIKSSISVERGQDLHRGKDLKFEWKFLVSIRKLSAPDLKVHKFNNFTICWFFFQAHSALDCLSGLRGWKQFCKFSFVLHNETALS